MKKIKLVISIFILVILSIFYVLFISFYNPFNSKNSNFNEPLKEIKFEENEIYF